MPCAKGINSRGRPPFQATDTMRAAVQQMAAFGITQSAMCAMIGAMAGTAPIDEKTLRAYFRHELDMGLQEAIIKVADALYARAVNGNTAAQIFFLKTRGGWRNTNRLEVSDQDDNPLPVETVPLDAAMMEAAYTRALEKYGTNS